MLAEATRHGSTQLGVKKNAPLRKIVETTYKQFHPQGVPMEADVLECGHVVQAPLDRNGTATSATRRRCRFCQDEAYQDWKAQQ